MLGTEADMSGHSPVGSQSHCRRVRGRPGGAAQVCPGVKGITQELMKDKKCRTSGRECSVTFQVGFLLAGSRRAVMSRYEIRGHGR